MPESIANIIEWIFICVVGLGIIGILIVSVIMVVGYKLVRQDMREFRERKREITERNNKMFRDVR